MHSGLSLSERAELALTGFVLLDLWSLVASEKEKTSGVGRGRMQMAGQTRRALQGIAMTCISIAATKPKHWNPFGRPHSLSEVHIEQWFGQLRSQYVDSDLTARGYFNAAARVARKTAKNQVRPPQTPVEEEALTPQECLGCIRCVLFWDVLGLFWFCLVIYVV